MDKFLKLFILMPEKGDLKKFIWSIVFYAFVPSIAAGILCLTIIGAVVAPAAAVVYTVFGLVLSLLHFIGYEFPAE